VSVAAWASPVQSLREQAAGRKVLMVAKGFPPSNSAGVHRTARFARMLPEFGWQPVVLTVSDDSENGETVADWVKTLRVQRTASWRKRASVPSEAAGETTTPAVIPAKTSANGLVRGLKSLLRNLRDLATATPDADIAWVLPSLTMARRLAREEQFDVVYTSGPPHSTHLVGLYLKRRLGLAWVADFRDPWARRPWGQKHTNPWGQRFLGWFERNCVSAADRVILNTPRMADEFRRHHARLPSEKFVAIPNGCDPDLAVRVAHLLAENSPRVPGTIHLCHPGSLYRRRDPRPIIDALAILHRQGLPASFEQVGSCDSSFAIEEYVRDRGLTDWVTVVPPVPHDEALRRMARADVLLLVQPGTDLQVPGKLFEMLLFRKPIVALAEAGATADIIDTYRLGVVVSGHDAEAIARGIQAVVQQPPQAEWDRACADFDGRQLTGELGCLLDELYAQKHLQ
jgi:glycosyltransferase involved in cell wall biosynthesis